MTISSTVTPRKEFSGNDVTTNFPITFPYTDDTDIVVLHTDSDDTETEWVLDGAGSTGYTISSADEVVANEAPASGETLLVYRETPKTQETDLRQNRRFNADVEETMFDKLTLVTQEIPAEAEASQAGAEAAETQAKLYSETAQAAAQNLSIESHETLGVTAQTDFVMPFTMNTTYKNVDIHIDGLKLRRSEYSLLNSTTVRFDVAPDNGAELEFVTFDPSGTISIDNLNIIPISDYSYNLNTAIAAIGATDITLSVDNATTVNTTVAVPSTLTLWRVGAGTLEVATEVTLTINSNMDEVDHRKFFNLAGSGTVRFGNNVSEIDAAWFGVDPSETSSNNHTYMEQALVGAAGKPACLKSNSTYEFNAPVSYAGQVKIKSNGFENTRWEQTGSGTNSIDHALVNGSIEISGIDFFYDGQDSTSIVIDIDANGLAAKTHVEDLIKIHHNLFSFPDGPATGGQRAIKIYTNDANSYSYWNHINNNFFFYQDVALEIHGDVDPGDPLGSINANFITDNTFVYCRTGIKLYGKSAGNLVSGNQWQPHIAPTHVAFADVESSRNIFSHNKIWDMSSSRYGYIFRDNTGTSGYEGDRNTIVGGSGSMAIEVDDETTGGTNQHNGGIDDADFTFMSFPNYTVYGLRVNNGLHVPSNWIMGQAEIAKTANFDMDSEDSGEIYTNNGAAGTVTGSLPDLNSVTVGCEFTFIKKANESFAVDPNGTDTIGWAGAGVSWLCNATNTSDTDDVNILIVKAVSTTHWMLVSYSGGWGPAGSALISSVPWDPGSIANGTPVEKEITVSGAALGDFPLVSLDFDLDDGLSLTCKVSAGKVTAILTNDTGGGIDPDGGAEFTVYAKVIKR